jgi:hypothetical protein
MANCVTCVVPPEGVSFSTVSTLKILPVAVAAPLRTSTRVPRKAIRNAALVTSSLSGICNPFNRVVAHRVDVSTFEIHERERLQHIIQLRSGELDAELLIPLHLSFMFEITHAIFVQNHFFDRQRDAGFSHGLLRLHWSRFA